MHHKLAIVQQLVLQQHRGARSQSDIALGCGNLSIILNFCGNQRDIAAQAANLAIVHHQRLAGAREGQAAARHEIAVCDIQRRGRKRTANIDRAGLADDHAIGVEHIDTAGGRQQAINVRRRVADHAV